MEGKEQEALYCMYNRSLVLKKKKTGAHTPLHIQIPTYVYIDLYVDYLEGNSHTHTTGELNV